MLTSGCLLLALAAAAGSQAAVPADERRRLLRIEDAGRATDAELRGLLEMARGGRGADGPLQALAIRTLGRLERRDLIPVFADMLAAGAARPHVDEALVLTLRAHAGEAGAAADLAFDRLLRSTRSATVLRHLPYTTGEQVRLAEATLLALAREPAAHGDVASAFETIARRHRKLAALGEDALAFLRRAATRSLPGQAADDAATPRAALAALTLAGEADDEVVLAGLRDADAQVRRTAVEALHAAGSAVAADARAGLTRAALADRHALVRYEALRGWARNDAGTHGCGPVLDALSDASPHVALAALAALGTACPDDPAVTARLTAEAQGLAASRTWHRPSHALVALARRDRQAAAELLPAFVADDEWQARMYAAHAAALLKDADTLARLAADAHDNVREAALGPLRALRGEESDDAFVAALRRSDYQLLRTAALALKDAPGTDALLAALVAAFDRVTAEKKDTSRDTRLALLERIRAMGGSDQRAFYDRHLRDFDPRVAAAVADACSAVSPAPCAADPRPLPRPPPPSARELATPVAAVVELDTGRRFTIRAARDVAPLAWTRFARLARDRYYDGLTFHRVVPSFVIQGGSPGANEYAGDGVYMRDELGGAHRRGTVGISTRGRHTGDAQIFVNLVDNPRLDFDYTVFGVVDEADMSAVDEVVEGTRIRRVTLVPGK